MVRRLIKRAVGKRLAKTTRTAAQKAALKKAVAASAKKRAMKGASKKVTKKVSRKVTKAANRKAAIARTEGLKLSRVSKGTKLSGQRRVSTANFQGKSGKALKKSTYKARLASSRAKYKQSSFGSKAKTKAIGLVSPTGIMRRKYVDLTTGENVRRNISRSIKVGAGIAAAQTGALKALGLPNAYDALKPRRRR